MPTKGQFFFFQQSGFRPKPYTDVVLTNFADSFLNHVDSGELTGLSMWTGTERSDEVVSMFKSYLFNRKQRPQ